MNRTSGVEVDVSHERPIVMLSGEWDIDNSDDLRSVLLGLADAGHVALVVDLAATRIIDSTVIQAMIEVSRRNVAITIRGTRESVYRTLVLSGVDAVFNIE